MESATATPLLDRQAEVAEYESGKDRPFESDPDESECEVTANVRLVRGKATHPRFAGKKAVRKTVEFKSDKMPLEDAKTACRREALIMCAARHAHCMHVYTTYFYRPKIKSAPNFYIIMGRADGWDLSTHLKPDGSQERWIGCLIRAVAYIHRLGIRHRDIKPKNVLIHLGEVLLSDFGAAHMSLGVTVPTTLPGWDKVRTAAYCAPEVDPAQGRTRGRSADVFALGAVILEMLLSHSYYDTAYSELNEITLYVHPTQGKLMQKEKSYAHTWDKVHRLLDKFTSRSRPVRAGWHTDLLALCRDMLDEERDRRPLGNTIVERWEALARRADGAGGTANASKLDCRRCSRGLDEPTKNDELVQACENRQSPAKIEELVRAGADPSTEGAIHQAAVANYVEIIRTLLNLGADVNARDHALQTALHYAAANRHEDATNLLLGRDLIDVNAQDVELQTPLHCAAAGGSEIVAEKLLDHGAGVNARDDGGLTPLHYAARAHHLDVVWLLLQRGADCRARGDNGHAYTPLELAHDRKFADVVKVLEDWERGEC